MEYVLRSSRDGALIRLAHEVRDGRRNEADLDHHHEKNAEPNRIYPQHLNNRKYDWHGEQDNRQSVEHATEDDIDHHQGGDNRHRRRGEASNESRDSAWHAA